jgi:hypothetical protein
LEVNPEQGRGVGVRESALASFERARTTLGSAGAHASFDEARQRWADWVDDVEIVAEA